MDLRWFKEATHSEPAAVKDEGTWDKAKKAASKAGYSKPDPFYAAAMTIYKSMGGALKKKEYKEYGGKGSSIKWLTGAAESMGKFGTTKEDPASVDEDTAQSAEDEVNDLVLKNPEMNAAALVNAMKAKGLAVTDTKQLTPVTNKKQKKETDTSSGNVAVLRAKESGVITARCRIMEGSARDNGIGPFKFEVVLLEEGLGNLKDAYFYTKEALESGVTLFEGKKLFADHPSKIEDASRPERSVRDIIGHYENLRVVEDKADGRNRLVADLMMLPDDPFKWARSLVVHAAEYNKKYPTSDFVGLSINASGDAEKMSIEDFLKGSSVPKSAVPKLQDAIAQGLSEVKVVTALTSAVSCDLVTEAGAGGKILQMLEQENNQMADEKKKEAEKKEAEDAAALKAKKEADDKAAADKANSDESENEDDGHDDEDQDKELIKKMMKKHLGDDESEDAEVMKHAHEAYEAYKEMGHEKDKAMSCAVEAMKLAKHMAAKKKEAEKKEAEGDDGDADDKKKESAEILKLKGENARLRESLNKSNLGKVLNTKIEALKVSESIKNEIRDAVGEPKSEKHIEHVVTSFMKGFKAKESKESLFSDQFIMTEKSTVVESKKKGLDFSGCVD